MSKTNKANAANLSYIQTLVDSAVKTVSVIFPNSGNREYTYKTKLDLKKGDLCVVKTPSGFSIVEVVVVHDEPAIKPDSKINYKWIVQTVNIPAHHVAECVDEDFVTAFNGLDSLEPETEIEEKFFTDEML